MNLVKIESKQNGELLLSRYVAGVPAEVAALDISSPAAQGKKLLKIIEDFRKNGL